MIVAIDIGNTFIKLACFQQDKIVWFHRFTHNETKEIIEKISELDEVSHIAISDVTGVSENWHSLEKLAKVVRFSSKTLVPFQVNYKSIETLGVDRLCLVAGALSQLSKNQAGLIIGTGTCITYDYITQKHHYIGGAISPGYKMRFEALHTLTKKLPLVEPIGNNSLVENDTNSSIRSGVHQGIKLELEGRIAHFLKDYSGGKVFLTGGDTETFACALKNSIFADNFLLLKGINEIVKHQELHSSYSI